MRTEREAFAIGRDLLLKLQRKLKRPPKRKLISGLVKEIIKKAGLRHDVRERYFKLLAKCALLGKEPLYNNFKRRKHHGKENESRINRRPKH